MTRANHNTVVFYKKTKVTFDFAEFCKDIQKFKSPDVVNVAFKTYSSIQQHCTSQHKVKIRSQHASLNKICPETALQLAEFTYIIRDRISGEIVYVGHTYDLIRRLYKHKLGKYGDHQFFIVQKSNTCQTLLLEFIIISLAKDLDLSLNNELASTDYSNFLIDYFFQPTNKIKSLFIDGVKELLQITVNNGPQWTSNNVPTTSSPERPNFRHPKLNSLITPSIPSTTNVQNNEIIKVFQTILTVAFPKHELQGRFQVYIFVNPSFTTFEDFLSKIHYVGRSYDFVIKIYNHWRNEEFINRYPNVKSWKALLIYEGSYADCYLIESLIQRYREKLKLSNLLNKINEDYISSINFESDSIESLFLRFFNIIIRKTYDEKLLISRELATSYSTFKKQKNLEKLKNLNINSYNDKVTALAEYKKNWYIQNKEKSDLRARQWKKNHPEYVRPTQSTEKIKLNREQQLNEYYAEFTRCQLKHKLPTYSYNCWDRGIYKEKTVKIKSKCRLLNVLLNCGCDVQQHLRPIQRCVIAEGDC